MPGRTLGGVDDRAAAAASLKDPTLGTASAVRLFFPEDPAGWPFTVTMPQASQVRIVMHLDALMHQGLFRPESHRWIHGFRGTVSVDLARLTFVNSPVCGWMINLSRSARPGRTEVHGTSPRVREIMRFLRLDALMTIAEA
jgi:anti-anti-sigma regulatory factor